jgi:hypothetical protein
MNAALAPFAISGWSSNDSLALSLLRLKQNKLAKEVFSLDGIEIHSVIHFSQTNS